MSRWPGCSPGRGRPRLWVRSCGRCGSGMCVSSMRSRRGCWPAWLGTLRSSAAVNRSPVSISMTRSGRRSVTPNRAPVTVTPGSTALNALLATVSSASAAPVIVATRLRKGSAKLGPRRGPAGRRCDQSFPISRRGRTAGIAGGLGLLRCRGYRRGPTPPHPLLGHCPQGPGGERGDRLVPEDAWTAIRYPRAVFDDQLQQWFRDAQVAEIAFTSRRKTRQVTAPLIVRRVRDASPAHVHRTAQGELFRVWRHHVVFTDSPLPMLTAEADHRRHAIIEQVIADLKNGPLARIWVHRVNGTSLSPAS